MLARGSGVPIKSIAQVIDVPVARRVFAQLGFNQRRAKQFGRFPHIASAIKFLIKKNFGLIG
jgi:hypothetical protein